MNSLKQNDQIRARKLCNLFRLTDDLNVINDGGELGNNFMVIYPEELQLNKENSNNLEASFLDLHIKIENGIYTDIYIKLKMQKSQTRKENNNQSKQKISYRASKSFLSRLKCN